MSLLRNSRFYILVVSLGLSDWLFEHIVGTVGLSGNGLSQLSQNYGLLAFGFLYLSMIGGPLYRAFPNLPGAAWYRHALRAIGVSAFYFAGLHTIVAFLGQLGGWQGVGFLPVNFIWSLWLGLGALVILTVLAATSFDSVIDRLTFPVWKKIHRWVYLAGTLTLIHVLLIGSHYLDLASPVSIVTFVLVAAYLLLHAYLFDTRQPRMRVMVLLTAILLGLVFWKYYLPAYQGSHHHPGLSAIFVGTPYARAHELQHDTAIGAVLHVDPNDNPPAGQPATVYVEFTDKDGLFQLQNCDCRVVVRNDTAAIDRRTLTQRGLTASFIITFPNPGRYQIEMTGTPLPGHEFDAFDLRYDVSAAASAGATASRVNHLWHYLLGAALLTLIARLLYLDFRPRRKLTDHNGVDETIGLTYSDSKRKERYE